MATLLTMYPVKGRPFGATEHRPAVLYTPTQLHCAYASGDLSDALCALRAPLDAIEARLEGVAMEYEILYGQSPEDDQDTFVPIPHRSLECDLLLVTAAQILTVPWEALSEDPEGKIHKRAAWAYLAALPPDTQIVVHLSH